MMTSSTESNNAQKNKKQSTLIKGSKEPRLVGALRTRTEGPENISAFSSESIPTLTFILLSEEPIPPGFR